MQTRRKRISIDLLKVLLVVTTMVLFMASYTWFPQYYSDGTRAEGVVGIEQWIILIVGLVIFLLL